MGSGGAILKFVSHSLTVLKIAVAHGWLPGARYTNLRDVKRFSRLGFLDINWRKYDYRRHLEAASLARPMLTVARDLEDKRDLRRVIDQAYRLAEFATHVVIVPKDPLLEASLNTAIPPDFLLGYSVPTRYGGTRLSPAAFRRPVHLLGGRPEVQRRLAELMPVFSIDANRFTLDAAFGDYFDGEKFRPHPNGGYSTCLTDSVKNITALWTDYAPARFGGFDGRI
jgi:hypothetical protein